MDDSSITLESDETSGSDVDSTCSTTSYNQDYDVYKDESSDVEGSMDNYDEEASVDYESETDYSDDGDSLKHCLRSLSGDNWMEEREYGVAPTIDGPFPGGPYGYSRASVYSVGFEQPAAAYNSNGGNGRAVWRPKSNTMRIAEEPPQTYAPERWPPIVDFLFVFSSFVAALVAAYFTIF